MFVVTSITSIQVETCNQFSCCSFKTDIFQSDEKMATLFYKIYHNFVMDNFFQICLTFESELNSEGFIHLILPIKNN